MNQNRWLRIFVVLAFSVIALQFLEMASLQTSLFDTPTSLAKLEASKEFIPLGQWETHFYHCEAKGEAVSCEKRVLPGNERVMLALPSVKDQERLLAQLKDVTHVNMIYTLSDKELEIFRNRQDIILVFLQSVQSHFLLSFGSQTFESTGNSSFTLPLDPRNLQKIRTISIEFELGSDPFFGPTTFPAALATSQKATEYLAMENRVDTGKIVATRGEIGFPLMLAAVAVVLDHSLAFGFISLFALATASRSFIAFYYSATGIWNKALEIGYTVSCAAAASLLILFLLILFGRNLKRIFRKKVWIPLLLIPQVVAFSYTVWRPDGIVTLDLLCDMAGTAIGFSIVLFFSVKHFFPGKQGVGAPADSDTFSTPRSTRIAQYGLLLFALAIHCYINFSELFLGGDSGTKNFFDWKHSMLFPSAITAALLETGSVTRRIKAVAQQEVQRAVFEQELNTGKLIQSRFMGPSRVQGASWRTRTLYCPAVKVSGDWYDVDEITFADGKKLVGIMIADAVGHGVGAALLTSVICSNWRAWKSNAGERMCPTNHEDRVRECSAAFRTFDKALSVLGSNSVATALMALFSPEDGEITILSAGHPHPHLALPAEGGWKVKGIPSAGNMLGYSGSEDADSRRQAAKATLHAGEKLYVYSDGILVDIPNARPFWKRVMSDKKTKDINATVWQEVRRVKASFQKNKESEDDLTVIVLEVNGG